MSHHLALGFDSFPSSLSFIINRIDMAEAAGLAVGVVALAGLFNTTVECFEFVQLGRTFGKDFQTSQLKLDSARLRLSRWGKSLGLDEDVQSVASLQGRFGSEANVKHAEALLGQIVELFADSEGVSKNYKSRASPQDDNLAVYNPQSDLEPAMAKLHNQMRQLAIDRQVRSGVRQKAKWALYQEKHFRRLIEDITELVDSLVGLFPAVQQQQRERANTELKTVLGEVFTRKLATLLASSVTRSIRALSRLSPSRVRRSRPQAICAPPETTTGSIGSRGSSTSLTTWMLAIQISRSSQGA